MQTKINYVYIIISGDSVSSLGFDSFEKAEQWLITERKCKKINNDWIYVQEDIKKNNYYYIRQIEII
jgi:hypothetical protein